jgi:hypothetical protein
MKEEYIIERCPHCNDQVQLYKNEFKCKIFRHGVYKKTGKQMGAHCKKTTCDRLKENDLIFGCGKPFMLILENEKLNVVICDYI